MPSPLAHAAAGYLIYRWLSGRSVELRSSLAAAGIALSLLPDIDSAAGLLLGNMGRYHNHMMGSPFFAVMVATAVGVAGRYWRGRFLPWFILALACYLAHIAMDFFTTGRGIMLLWPLTEERYRPPVSLFYGVHWSDGLFSIRHIWTVLSEIATLLVILLLALGYRHLRRRWITGRGNGG